MMTKKILVPQSQSSSPIMQYTILQVLFGPLYFTLFPGGSDSKASAYNVGDLGSIPGLGRSPGEGNGTPLQYSCLKNPMDRGAWYATVCGVTKSQTSLHFSLHPRRIETQGTITTVMTFCLLLLLRDAEGCGRGVQDGEHMYTHGGFTSMYGKSHYNTVK